MVGDCKVSVSALIDGLKGYKTKSKDWVEKLRQKS
jgi:hypothetical protein